MYSTDNMDNIVYCMNCMNYSHYYVDNFILVWITMWIIMLFVRMSRTKTYFCLCVADSIVYLCCGHFCVFVFTRQTQPYIEQIQFTTFI